MIATKTYLVAKFRTVTSVPIMSKTEWNLVKTICR